MANVIWIPSPSTYMKDVNGSVLGVLIEPAKGEVVCWHVSHEDGERTITGYTIVQRKTNEQTPHRSR